MNVELKQPLYDHEVRSIRVKSHTKVYIPGAEGKSLEQSQTHAILPASRVPARQPNVFLVNSTIDFL